MLFYNTINAKTLSLLKRVQNLPDLAETRLVGGTALALQLGHRISVEENGLRLAGIKDIGAMKVNAIVNRGTRKDFVDMARLLQDNSLDEILLWYRAKYPDANLALALRSLSYFVDAETMPMPRMLVPFDWNDAKDRIRAAIRKFIITDT